MYIFIVYFYINKQVRIKQDKQMNRLKTNLTNFTYIFIVYFYIMLPFNLLVTNEISPVSYVLLLEKGCPHLF